MSVQLSWSAESDRRGLRHVVAALFPGTDTLPAGLEVGVAEHLIDRVVAANPGLVTGLLAVSEIGDRSGAEVTVADLERENAAVAEEAVFALSVAYYMAPEVKAALRYPGQLRRPIADATADERVSADLLAPVVSRGPIYVDPQG